MTVAYYSYEGPDSTVVSSRTVPLLSDPLRLSLMRPRRPAGGDLGDGDGGGGGWVILRGRAGLG